MRGASEQCPDNVPPVLTIGHSTRTIEEFVRLLRASGVEHLVDVRRFPGSRRHPQFGKGTLAARLREEGIGYSHLPGLGAAENQILTRPIPGGATLGSAATPTTWGRRSSGKTSGGCSGRAGASGRA